MTWPTRTELFRFIPAHCMGAGMLGCSRRKGGRRAWDRAGVVGVTVIRAADIQEAVTQAEDIPEAADSGTRTGSPTRIAGRLRRMILVSLTRCWTSSEPNFRWIRRESMPQACPMAAS